MKSYLEDIKELFKNYKYLGESFLISLPEKRWTWKANEDTNSIAIIIKHLAGNMLSRWTDFLTTDGEKEWRNREDEFIYQQESKAYLLEQWQRGWNCLFQALETL
ncbi:MAG: DUF1572 family protein, partial [Thermonemataceae bacterium]|nr:DUF1572 family protein [Thermonemataceae bacterium]